MKKTAAKLAALLLVFALIFGLTGCSLFEPDAPAPSPTPTPTPEPEPEELLFVQPGKRTVQYARGIEALNRALKPQGIALRVETYEPQQYLDKIQLLVSSGVNFDLFSFTKDYGTLAEMSALGLVKPIEPDSKLKTLFADKLWENASVGGKVLGVPVYMQPLNGFDTLLGYRTDILEKAGYEKFPTQGFMGAFAEMQRVTTAEGKDPNHFTWLGSPDDLPLWLHPTYDSYPFSVDNFMNLIMITEKGKVKSFYESAEFEGDARQMRAFYSAGTVSDKILEGGNKAIASGKILPSQGFNVHNATVPKLAFAKLGEGGDYVTDLGSAFTCVPKTAKNPKLSLKLLSWLYSSQENFDLFHYGTEGKDYTLDEKGRMTRANPSFLMDVSLTGYLPLLRYGPKVSSAYIKEVNRDGEKAQVAKSALFTFDNSELLEECRLLEEAVRTYIYPIKMGVKTYGENIDEAIEQLNRAGLKQYVAEYKKQYEVFLKAGEETPKPEETDEPEEDAPEEE